MAGYFSPELNRALYRLGIEQNKSLQAFLGKAIDELIRRLAKDFEILTSTAENVIRLAMLKITIAKCL